VSAWRAFSPSLNFGPVLNAAADSFVARRYQATMSVAVAGWFRKELALSPEDVAERYVDYALAVVGPPGDWRENERGGGGPPGGAPPPPG
jgi:hypothetical protein